MDDAYFIYLTFRRSFSLFSRSLEAPISFYANFVLLSNVSISGYILVPNSFHHPSHCFSKPFLLSLSHLLVIFRRMLVLVSRRRKCTFSIYFTEIEFDSLKGIKTFEYSIILDMDDFIWSQPIVGN